MSEPRAELGKALSNYLTPEQVSKLIDEILAIEKRRSAEFQCKECGQRQMQWTTIPDASAVTRALTDLMSQAFGRPQEANNTQDPILFYRLTNMEELDALQLVQEERGGLETEHPENGQVRAEADEGERLQQAESRASVQSKHPALPKVLRRCIRCKLTKPTSEFPVGKRGPQICVDCRS